MFKIVDRHGWIYDAYGTYVDKDGDVQFILCGNDGAFYCTNVAPGYYKRYEECQ